MSNTFRDRDILTVAQGKGPFATLLAYFRLSGPGWLQSAITLGGGSLAGALYLGMAGGYSLLWVQLVAIFCGVVMLSAITYVTLSTGKRPYAAINEHINPVLGTAWILATILANMIFILPQFSLAYDALQMNLLPEMVDNDRSKYIVTGIIAACALVIVLLSLKPGWMSKTFDLLLKLIVGAIVVCFVLAVVKLFMEGLINTDLFMGFIPDLDRLSKPAPDINQLLVSAPLADNAKEYWDTALVNYKQEKMIATAATAVGINMTFLLPYSMLSRGWDKTFRGLARWDLITGMAIPFIVVTSCIVITTAFGFHGQADESLLSSDPAVVQQSDFFDTVAGALQGEKGKLAAIGDEDSLAALAAVEGDEKKALLAEMITKMPEEERKLAFALAKPNSLQLAKSLEPLFSNKEHSKIVFGVGVLAMAFSTIVILMLINGFAFGEIFGNYNSVPWRIIGSVLCLAVGVCWVVLWGGESKTYLAIVASTFAILLLPIAYFAFFLMMNSRSLLGDEKPTGARMFLWNILMIFSLVIVSIFAYTSLEKKLDGDHGQLILGGVITFGLLVLFGFSATLRGSSGDDSHYEEQF